MFTVYLLLMETSFYSYFLRQWNLLNEMKKNMCTYIVFFAPFEKGRVIQFKRHSSMLEANLKTIYASINMFYGKIDRKGQRLLLLSKLSVGNTFIIKSWNKAVVGVLLLLFYRCLEHLDVRLKKFLCRLKSAS